MVEKYTPNLQYLNEINVYKQSLHKIFFNSIFSTVDNDSVYLF